MPSTTDHDGEEIVDAPGKDGNASIPEQVKRPNPWRKMMMVMMSTFRKYVEKIQILLKSDKNKGYFTRMHMYIHDNISLNSS
jgi:hypothetical protein